MAKGNDDKGAGDYAREALDQWREAARLGSRALAERKAAKAATDNGGSGRGALGSGVSSAVKEHLPDPSAAGGELGELADATLAKMGFGGKLAAKAGVGHRVVHRLLPDVLVEGWSDDGDGNGGEEAEGNDEEPVGSEDHLFDASTPLPIQESVDIAVPVAAVFDLSTRFEELPRFSDRIDAVEVDDDTHLTVVAKIGGHRQALQLEIVGEEPEERLDWDGIEGVEHSGVVTFHPLAPRLTRVELTIEQPHEGMREKLLRRLGHPERVVREELRRFKAYAELWDEANDYRSADFKDPASEPEDAADEPPEDEEPLDDEPEDEEPPEDEADEPEDDEEADEPLEDEQEAEPATRG